MRSETVPVVDYSLGEEVLFDIQSVCISGVDVLVTRDHLQQF